MVSLNNAGGFSKTDMFMQKCLGLIGKVNYDSYGRRGVAALSAATPVDTGATANSWFYEVSRSGDTVTLSFHNSNINRGMPIAILIQYGHATRNGGWVEGRDYINPALQPIFDDLSKVLKKEVVIK